MSTAVRPLLPPIRLRVGVTGHRIPPRLPKQSELPLRANVDRILAAIIASVLEVENDYAERAQARDARRKSSTTRADVTTRAAECVIVSSFAEGSDSIVAEAGLAAGCRLEGVLPFSRGEYMRDFATEEARKRFRPPARPSIRRIRARGCRRCSRPCLRGGGVCYAREYRPSSSYLGW